MAQLQGILTTGCGCRKTCISIRNPLNCGILSHTDTGKEFLVTSDLKADALQEVTGHRGFRLYRHEVIHHYFTGAPNTDSAARILPDQVYVFARFRQCNGNLCPFVAFKGGCNILAGTVPEHTAFTPNPTAGR